MPSRLRASFLPFVAVLFCGLVVTAAPAPAERVTVKKADGKTVAGELLWADHDGVGVKPAGAKAEPVLVPWAEVASVSNGLTRSVAIAKWKAGHAGNLCVTCDGDRTVKHEACAGTGVDPAAKQPCVPCKATGSAGKCTNPKCKDGQVECPGPCLKRSSTSPGKWVNNGGGWKYEYKVRGGGSGYISEPHIGEVFVFKSNAGAELKGECPVCLKKAKVDCGTCGGKGQLACKTCGGATVTGPACKGCQKGRAKCEPCKGKGLAAKT